MLLWCLLEGRMLRICVVPFSSSAFPHPKHALLSWHIASSDADWQWLVGPFQLLPILASLGVMRKAGEDGRGLGTSFCDTCVTWSRDPAVPPGGDPGGSPAGHLAPTFREVHCTEREMIQIVQGLPWTICISRSSCSTPKCEGTLQSSRS